VKGLERFRDAQDDPASGFDCALGELQAGAKRSHWIWYVFPQLTGLGGSVASEFFGIRGLAEAQEYLRDPVLRSRLLAVTDAVAAHLSHDVSLETLLGSSIDALKLVSSLTLFGTLAERPRLVGDPVAHNEIVELGRLAKQVLDAAGRQGYGRCAYTLDRLAR
jgi:uncharacterized protein (DUF1810 family)